MRIWGSRMIRTTLLALTLVAGPAVAEETYAEQAYADVWSRCAAHIIDGASLDTDGLEELDPRQATKGDQMRDFPQLITHRYSRIRDDGRRIAVTSESSNVFKKTVWAVMREVSE